MGDFGVPKERLATSKVPVLAMHGSKTDAAPTLIEFFTA